MLSPESEPEFEPEDELGIERESGRGFAAEPEPESEAEFELESEREESRHGSAPESAPEPEVFRRMRERHYGALLDTPPECTLTELRKSCDRSQAAVAAVLGVKQIAVSRLERRTDLHVSTLRDYVAALGGQLELTVRLPRRAVRLTLEAKRLRG